MREKLQKHPIAVCFASILFWVGYSAFVEALPVDWQLVAGYAGIGLMAIALALFLYAYLTGSNRVKEQENIIKEQQNVITELEVRQWRRAMREPFLTELTDVLQKMHKQLMAIADKKALMATDEEAVFEVQLELIEKIGIRPRFIPRNTKPPLSRIRTLYFMRQIGKSFKKNELKYLHNLSGEMDKRGMGLIQEKKTNKEYKALSQHLDRLRANVVSDELNKAIDIYLLYSYALSSSMLFNQYIGLFTKDYIKWIRVKYRHMISETQMRDAIDIQMNHLLVNVARHVEDALLGEEPK